MSQDETRKFLLEFKKAATAKSGVDLVPRKDSLETIKQLGLTKRNLEGILLDLSVADYCDGPKADRDKPGEIWEFGKNLDGHEVYIKLKVVAVGESRIAKCISFHIAQYPMKFPYR